MREVEAKMRHVEAQGDRSLNMKALKGMRVNLSDLRGLGSFAKAYLIQEDDTGCRCDASCWNFGGISQECADLA
jgi:hypothetical protein